MKIETVDGSTVYENLYVNEIGQTLNFLIREGGTVSLYSTTPHIPGHAVIWDSHDGPPNEAALICLDWLGKLHDGVTRLQAAARISPPMSPERVLRDIKNWDIERYMQTGHSALPQTLREAIHGIVPE